MGFETAGAWSEHRYSPSEPCESLSCIFDAGGVTEISLLARVRPPFSPPPPRWWIPRPREEPPESCINKEITPRQGRRNLGSLVLPPLQGGFGLDIFSGGCRSLRSLHHRGGGWGQGRPGSGEPANFSCPS